MVSRDWWKLEPMTTPAAGTAVVEAVEAHDRHMRGTLVTGTVVPGLDAPEAEPAASSRVAAAHGLVRDFAVGRTIFGEVALAWTRGGSTDAAAVFEMARRRARLCAVSDDARALAGAGRSGARRSYRLVEHEDTRGIGRIRAVHDSIADAVDQDRADFARWP